MRAYLDALVASAAVAGALAAAPLPRGGAGAPAYPDHPPAAHTGGFGEPTCLQCHAGSALNDPAGSLAFEGVPEAYLPGGRYRIGVLLVREGLAAGGFQLAVRCEDGRQAGALSPADAARVSVAPGPAGVSYAHQTADGTVPSRSGGIRWEVDWTAPAPGCGAVRFDAAANAGNGDDSALGDYVYTKSLLTRLSAGR